MPASTEAYTYINSPKVIMFEDESGYWIKTCMAAGSFQEQTSMIKEAGYFTRNCSLSCFFRYELGHMS